jgi:hypothetical protein
VAEVTTPSPTVTIAGRRRAAGIYGAIITAAVMTAAGSALSTSALAVAVLVTLVVYWLAENYAEVLGEQVTGGRLPSLAQIRRLLAGGWPMVSASFAPLVVLVVLVLVRLAGASASSAATAGVGAAVVLLTVHG